MQAQNMDCDYNQYILVANLVCHNVFGPHLLEACYDKTSQDKKEAENDYNFCYLTAQAQSSQNIELSTCDLCKFGNRCLNKLHVHF